MKNIIKKYPVLAGIPLIFLLAGIVLFYREHQQSQKVESTITTKELEKEFTIDGFKEPGDLVQYFLEGINKKDIDTALRSCAIDERTLHFNLVELINYKKSFSIDMYTAPANYVEYQPLISSELAGRYGFQIEALMKELGNSKKYEIEEIVPIKPEIQLKSDYLLEMKEESSRWGADQQCEYMAHIKNEEKDLIVTFTLSQNYDIWKIAELGSELAGTTSAQAVLNFTEEIYRELKGNIEEKQFWKKVKEKNADTEDEEVVEKEEKANPKKDVLPPNYFIVNAAYGKTPQDTIQKFVLEIQKKDFTAAMCYGEINEEGQTHTSYEQIQRQSDFAGQMKRFFYNFMGITYKEENKIDTIGMTGGEILMKVNPKNMPYLDLNKVVQAGEVEKACKDENQYIGVFYYEGHKYVSGFTVKEEKAGWRIQSLSAEGVGLDEGEVVKISEKKYRELMKLK